MLRVNIFIMRVIMSAGLAVFIMRSFYPDANLIYAALLGFFMAGMAYILEYWRKSKSK